MKKEIEIEFAREYFDAAMNNIEANCDDVIYEIIDPECKHDDLCEKVNFDTIKEVIALGFQKKYGVEWHTQQGDRTMKTTTIKEGDKVKSNGKYADIQRKFGDTVQTVKYVGKIPSCKQDVVWLVGGGGCFMADGFTVVEEADAEAKR